MGGKKVRLPSMDKGVVGATLEERCAMTSIMQKQKSALHGVLLERNCIATTLQLADTAANATKKLRKMSVPSLAVKIADGVKFGMNVNKDASEHLEKGKMSPHRIQRTRRTRTEKRKMTRRTRIERRKT